MAGVIDDTWLITVVCTRCWWLGLWEWELIEDPCPWCSGRDTLIPGC